MKSFIITLFAAFSTAMGAMAQHVDKAYTMHVNSADGTSVSFKFDTEPTATFSEGQMTIEATSGTPVKFVMDNVANITFSGEAVTGIETTTTGKLSMSVYATDGGIVINGMKANSKVSVYDASGSQIATAYSDANGHAVVTVNKQKGVFVVNTPDNSFKFIK